MVFSLRASLLLYLFPFKLILTMLMLTLSPPPPPPPSPPSWLTLSTPSGLTPSNKGVLCSLTLRIWQCFITCLAMNAPARPLTGCELRSNCLLIRLRIAYSREWSKTASYVRQSKKLFTGNIKFFRSKMGWHGTVWCQGYYRYYSVLFLECWGKKKPFAVTFLTK